VSNQNSVCILLVPTAVIYCSGPSASRPPVGPDSLGPITAQHFPLVIIIIIICDPKTKTHIYNAIVKSTITYAAETWCLKAKTVAKLNSTEMDFWRRSARISRKDKIRNTIIKQKMNVTRSLLDDINTKQVK